MINNGPMISTEQIKMLDKTTCEAAKKKIDDTILPHFVSSSAICVKVGL